MTCELVVLDFMWLILSDSGSLIHSLMHCLHLAVSISLLLLFFVPHSKWDSAGTEANETKQRDIPHVNGYWVRGSTIDEFMMIEQEQRRLMNSVRNIDEQRRLDSLLSRSRRLIQYNTTELIAGGSYHLNYTNDPAYQEVVDTALSTPKSIAPAGNRTLGPWNCQGLTGISCCSMIKHEVRDADIHGNALQCWIEQWGGDGCLLKSGGGGCLLTKGLCEASINMICIYETSDGMVNMSPILAYERVIRRKINEGYDITRSE